MFFAVTLINKKFEQKSIFNVLTFKENISKLITNPDNVYINKDYQALVSYYKTISKSDSCVMIFTNEVAIPYLLKKETCSKYYLMYTATPKEIQNNLIAQLTAPVRWTQSMEAMISFGATSATEVGPGKVLQGLFKKVDRAFQTESAALS